MKKGFTLVEMIVVIAILATVSVLIGTNFFGLIGSANEYEYENLYKYLNEAACVYVDSKDYAKKAGKKIDGVDYPNCTGNCDLSSSWILQDGYIDDQAYLLNKEVTNNIDNYTIRVTRDDGEKKCCVLNYINESGVIVAASGEGAC